MARLILVRHGATDWNGERRWQGQADPPLNARGLEQAAALAQVLQGSGMSALYSSDLQRACQTAEALSLASGLPLNLEPRLREVHLGEWQGLLTDEIRTRYAEAFERRSQDPMSIAPPGGETGLQVQQRALAAVEEILRRHPEETVGIVSHGFTLAVLRLHYESVPPERLWELVLGNCEIVEIGISHVSADE